MKIARIFDRDAETLAAQYANNIGKNNVRSFLRVDWRNMDAGGTVWQVE
jgi:hypothetical protein